MKVLLLTLLQLFYIGGISFTLPNGFPTEPNRFPSNLLNVLPNGFPKGIFNGMPTGVMSVPTGLRSSLPALNIVEGNSKKGSQNNTCCFGGACFSPCPLASGGIMPMPMQFPLSPPAPVMIPARTYYEPVVHNHPPLHKIRHIIKQDRDRKRKRHRSTTYDSSSDRESCSGTDTETDSDSFIQDSAIDYHEDVIHVNM